MLYNDDGMINSNATGQGAFITFEGIDGSGKTTQMSELISYLVDKGQQVISLREPGGTKIGETIRTVLLDKKHSDMRMETELLLFAAARAQLVREIIAPAIVEGKWVVCDRFMDSSLAYQGCGRGLDLDMIEAINAFAVADCKPNVTFLLDLPVETAAERMVSRNSRPDRIDNEGLEFMRRVRKGYLDLAARDSQRIVTLDANMKQDDISNKIRSYIKEGFGI